jgi:hypothetical protein
MTGPARSPAEFPPPYDYVAGGDDPALHQDRQSLNGARPRLWDRIVRTAPLFVALWAMLAIVSFLRVPIPGINEPHYLAKARAFWNPGWCAGDLFLESASPHQAFYLLIGWMTRFLTLGQTALVGRIAALAIVAWGWLRLTRSLEFSACRSKASLVVVLLLQSLGSWSGEWLVGGVESKVFAYGLAFAGLGAFVARRSTAAGVWLGLATTMHPLVGGWSIAAAAISEFIPFSKGRITPDPSRMRRLFVTGLWWIVMSAPGIYWALPAIQSGDAVQARIADFIQVTYRLPHHLDAWTFARESHRFFAGLIVIWWLLRRLTPANDPHARFDRIVIVGVAIALAACILTVGSRPWPREFSDWQAIQLKILKFYPFRLADLLVPVAVGLSAATLWDSIRTLRRRTAWTILAAALVCAVAIPNLDQRPSRQSAIQHGDWLATLQWVRENTPRDALVHAANDEWAVKWYAERPEYANFKDCPQDAPGIIEWNRRLNFFARWTRDSFANDSRFTADELAKLHSDTGIKFLIVSRLGPFATEPVYANGTFRIYRVGSG